MNKKSIFAAFILLSSQANAADYLAHPQPAPQPIPVAAPLPVKASWAGCYGGLHTGIGLSGMHSTFAESEIYSASYINDSHFYSAYPIGGGQVGCNHVQDNYLLGIEFEADFGRNDKQTTKSQTDPVSYTLNSHSKWSAGLSLRAGYTYDNILFYGKAGVEMKKTYTSLNYNSISYLYTDLDVTGTKKLYRPLWQTFYDADATRTQYSPMLGVGAEYAIDPLWTVRAELDATYSPFAESNLIVRHVGPYNNRNTNPPINKDGYVGYDKYNARDPVLGDIVSLKMSSIDMKLKLGVNRRF